MKVLKIIAYSLIILLFAWINYALYKTNRADQPRLFKPTEEKIAEFIPHTNIKKPDFSLSDNNILDIEEKEKNTTKPQPKKAVDTKKPTTEEKISSITQIDKIEGLEQIILDAGLVDIQTINNNILVDLKYSSTDNFLGQDVYGNLSKAYLQEEVAEKLSKAQGFLTEINADYKLLVYDGVRPRSVQKLMWDVVKGTAQQRYVASPSGTGSMHNYGASVDLTIADENGQALDMGTPFDFFGNESQPRHENQSLKNGKITSQNIENRKLLRSVMKKAGFIGIQSEWWHFNGFSKTETKSKYSIIE